MMAMEKQTLEKFLNKTVKLYLKNNNIYTLTITNVKDTDITAIDKFGNEITISNSDISVIEKIEGIK